MNMAVAIFPKEKSVSLQIGCHVVLIFLFSLWIQMHHVGILVVSDNWISPSFNSLGILDLHPIFPIFHQSASDIKNPIHKSFISRMQILAHRTGPRYTSIHTWYLSRAYERGSWKFFLAGVNFYRFNAKNWQFTVYFAVITQKIGNLLCILS